MGQTQSHINISPKAPTIIMMVGLQGAGKTTSAGKLGLMFKKQENTHLWLLPIFIVQLRLNSYKY